MEPFLHDAPASAVLVARDAARVVSLSPAQKAVVSRFARRRRRVVRAVAQSHPYFADLLVSFPAVLFAIAHGRGPAACHARALVLAGAPLKEIASALGLPLWTRRVPAEGCGAGLMRPLPDGPLISARIGNLMPTEAADWPLWLEAISLVYPVAGERFSLWVARELKRLERPRSVEGIAAIAVWAWYGAQRRNRASDLIGQPWHAGLSLGNAARVARAWLDALEFLLLEAPRPIGLAPPADNAVEGFTFIPLAWGEDLISEGHLMRNCLSGYASSYVAGSRVWSVHRDSRAVADLELAFADTRRGVPRLVQLRAVANTDAPDEVWAAAYQWLGRWRLLDAPNPVKGDAYRRRPGSWLEIWGPLWRAVGVRSGLPRPVVIDYAYTTEAMNDALFPFTYLRLRGS